MKIPNSINVVGFVLGVAASVIAISELMKPPEPSAVCVEQGAREQWYATDKYPNSVDEHEALLNKDMTENEQYLVTDYLKNYTYTIYLAVLPMEENSCEVDEFKKFCNSARAGRSLLNKASAFYKVPYKPDTSYPGPGIILKFSSLVDEYTRACVFLKGRFT